MNTLIRITDEKYLTFEALGIEWNYDSYFGGNMEFMVGNTMVRLEQTCVCSIEVTTPKCMFEIKNDEEEFKFQLSRFL